MDAKRTRKETRTQSPSSDTTLALLEVWDAEDATDDQAELAARRRDGEEVREGLAANPLRLRSSRA